MANRPTMAALLLSLMLALLSLATATTTLDRSSLYDPYAFLAGPLNDTSVYAANTPSHILPPEREGTVYGNVGGDLIYFAGGVALYPTLTASNYPVFTDIYILDTTNRRFIACTPQLPTGSYFGVGGWSTARTSLYVHQGRYNPTGSGVTNQYLTNLIRIDWSNRDPRAPAPSVQTITLSPPVTGRQYASSILLDDRLYVFGGLTGSDGTVTITGDRFYAIQLPTAASTQSGVTATVTTLAQSGTYFPADLHINPTIFTQAARTHLYFWSGLYPNSSTFLPATTIYVYSIATNTWLAPIAPVLSGFQWNTDDGLPNSVWAAWAMTSDWSHLFLAGGDNGFVTDSSGGPGSVDRIYHFDLRLLNDDPVQGSVVISRLAVHLPTPVESSVLGVVSRPTFNDSALVLYSGAQYPDSNQNYALGYVGPLVVTLPLPDTIPREQLYEPYAFLSAPVDVSSTYAANSAQGALPAEREGTVYGNVGGDLVYFAGGVALYPSTVNSSYTAFTDIWILDSANQRFVRCTSTLTRGSFFGVGGWSAARSSLYIHQGRYDTSGSGTRNVYETDLVRVDWSGRDARSTTPTVQRITLSRAVAGRQYASSIVLGERLYVYGGLTGVDGAQETSAADRFYSIDLPTAASTQSGVTATVRTLATSNDASTFPVGVWVNPTVFTCVANTHLYFYSGLHSDLITWFDPSRIYVYEIAGDRWLAPLTPKLSGFTELPAQLPGTIWGGWALAHDSRHLFLLGGDDGMGPNEHGTHDKVFHFDLTALEASPTTGQVVITIESFEMPFDAESPLAAIVYGPGSVADHQLLLFSGAQYTDSNQNYALGYVGQRVLSWTLPATLSSADHVDAFYKARVDDMTGKYGASSSVPAEREGTVMGNVGGELVYFAGGVQLYPWLASSTFTVFRDIWIMDVARRQFIACTPQLPTGSYFGLGGWLTATSSLYVHQGRFNSDGSGVNNQYLTDLIRIDWSGRDARSPTPTVQRITFSRGVSGRQYASSLLIATQFYVFGGLGGAAGVDVPTSDVFYVIDVPTGASTVANAVANVRILPSPSDPSVCPVDAMGNPAMFTSKLQTHIYFYSGLASSLTEWSNPARVFVFEIATSRWIAPIVPVLSSTTALAWQLPNAVWNGWCMDGTWSNLFLVGGDDGMAPNVPGTHNKIFHADLSALNVNPTGGRIVFSVLEGRLPKAAESPVVGAVNVDGGGGGGQIKVALFSGAQYADSNQNYALGYVGQMVVEVAVVSSSSSSSSTSDAVIAVSTVFSVIGAVLLVAIAYVVYARVKRGGGGGVGSRGKSTSHSNSSSPGSTNGTIGIGNDVPHAELVSVNSSRATEAEAEPSTSRV